MREYFKRAEKEKWALGQFNFSNSDVLEAIVLAAKKLKAPVILGTSEGESKSLGLEQAVALVKSYEENGLPLFLNLDHAKTFEYIKKAIGAGYKAVHFDGSRFSLKKNIEITKKVVALARKKGVWVEGEVGLIKGASRLLKKIPKLKLTDLTDPKEAQDFVLATKVNSLAVNIGSFHGMRAKGRNPKLNLERLKEIKKAVGKTPLVLHGGSGVPDTDVRKAIGLGIVKININTELRVAYTQALRRSLIKKPKETVPYKYKKEIVKAVQEVVEEKIKLFGSANKI